MEYDIAIVGGGPAGLTTGIYAARSKLTAIIFDSGASQIAEALTIENYPGFKHVSGEELLAKMRKQAELAGVKIADELIIDILKDTDYTLLSTSGKNYTAKSIILAMGATHNAGIKGEVDFIGRGVSYCAICDGIFFRDRVVAVIGGGNTAIEEAIFLAQHAKKVYLICKNLNADPALQDKAIENPKIEISLDKRVVEITGDKMVGGITMMDYKNRERMNLSLDGVFITTSIPVNQLAKKLGLETGNGGYLITDHQQKTNIKGIFSAGDITGGLKQVVVACSEGAIAAMAAYDYIKG